MVSCHFGCADSAAYWKKDSYLWGIDSKHCKAFPWSGSTEFFLLLKAIMPKPFWISAWGQWLCLQPGLSCQLALNALTTIGSAPVAQGFFISTVDRDWNLCISLSPALCIMAVRIKVLLTNLVFFFICWLQFAQSPRSCPSHVYPTPSFQQSFEQKRRNEDLGISMFFMVDFLYVFNIINSQGNLKILYQYETTVLGCRTPGNQISNY